MADKQTIIKYSQQLGLSNREIARKLGLNRKTVDRYIQKHRKSEAKGKQLDSIGSSNYFEPPTYTTSKRVSSALTEEAVSIITDCLRQNEDRDSKGQSKIKYKGIDIYEKLISQGHKIGYSTVCLYLSKQNKAKREVNCIFA